MVDGRNGVIVVFTRSFGVVLIFCTVAPSEDTMEKTPSPSPSEVVLFSYVGSNRGVMSLCNILAIFNIALLVDFGACGRSIFCLCSSRWIKLSAS